MQSRILGALLAASILSGGCGEGSKKHTDRFPLELQPTSIANVLILFREAYEGRDLDTYGALIDPGFSFVYAPQDVGGPNDIPSSWVLTDEMLSAQHMFAGDVNKDGYRAEEIHLSFTAGPEEAVDGHPDWRKVVLSDVNLQIIARHDGTNDPLWYEVTETKEDLYLVQTNQTAPGTGLRIWKIVLWEDKPLGKANHLAVAHTTWGRIKSSWR